MRWVFVALIVVGGGSAACDESARSPSAPPPGATAFTLTAAGGTFVGTGPLAGVELTVPNDAVDGPVDLWMAPPEAEQPLPETGRMVGPEVQFGPAELALQRTAELTVPFDPDRVAETGVELGFVKVWRVGPDGWVIDEPVAAPTADRVTSRIDHLGRFGAGVELD